MHVKVPRHRGVGKIFPATVRDHIVPAMCTFGARRAGLLIASSAYTMCFCAGRRNSSFRLFVRSLPVG